MNNIKICVFGAGKWGLNHIKTLNQLGVLGGVVDIDEEKRNKVKKLFPNIVCFKNIKEIKESLFDGYIIATPASTHTKLAKMLLQKNKAVLVEKPLSLSLKEAYKIKKKLKEVNGRLVVGHLLLFHPAIQKMKSMIDNGHLGDLQYIYSNRLNLGVVRKEEDVFWSFAPHDVSLFQYFSNSFPNYIKSLGGAFLQKNIHDTTITYLKYPNGIQGHIYVSWLHPFKEHRLVVIGSKGSLHFEDSLDNKSLIFYESESENNTDNYSLKNKQSKSIRFEETLPLTNELEYFIEVIKGRKNDKGTINEGLEVVKILEMASNSLLK